jgi:phage baseplate assembly protein W
VNRPDFGCGLLQLVFAPNSSELAGATQFLVQGALQQSLGDVINLTGVVVAQAESTLTVTVQYTIRDTQQQVVAQFVRGGIIS